MLINNISMQKFRKGLFLLIILSISSFIVSCSSEQQLPVKGEFPDVKLINYNGEEFHFSDLKGKIIVVSYIYTNCPDICHLTTKKLNQFKKNLGDDLSNKVEFVSITFDPTRDTPDVLKHHVQMMGLDMNNWYFVTGRRDLVYKTIEVAGINPIVDELKNNDQYTFNHRDRLSLVDQQGRIRKHYKGSTFDEAELKKDIKTLL